jgi:outer membrane protein assembly factor BamB
MSAPGRLGTVFRRSLAAKALASLAFVVVLTIVASGSASAATDQAVAYQLDAAHDGAQSETITTPLSQLWSDPLPGSVSYPLVVNGVVYVVASTSSNADTLYAIKQATGATLWSKSFSSTYPWAAPAYDAGQVFVISESGTLTAVNATTGATAWSMTLPGQSMFSSPPTAADGLVFVGGAGSGGTVYAVTQASGQLVWSMPVENGDHSSPAVDASGVYVTYSCDQDYDFAPITGALLWHHAGSCEGGGGKTPVLADGDVFGRDAVSGNVILSAASGASVGTFASTPAPAVSGGVTYTLSGGSLIAVGDDGMGTNLWSFTGDGQLDTAPLVVGDLVIEGSSAGNLYVLSAATGALDWSAAVGAGIAAPDEQNVSGPLTGLGAGEHTVIVPAGTKLVAYDDASDTTGTPTNATAPAVLDTPAVGEPAGADVGVWSGLPTSYSYQWQLCDGQGQSCAAIQNATGEAYTPTAAQLGHTLEVSVSATNSSGTSTTVTSAASSPIVAAPASIVAPAITGTAAQGQTLTATPGTWTQNPTSYAYQWLRCAGGACSAVSGGTSTTYVVSASDVGAALEVRVTAANSVGKSSATSPATGAVPQLATTLTLAASSLHVPVGGRDTFTATVTPAVNGGSVTFSDPHGVLCGPIALGASTATATCIAIALSPGIDTITATYSGDAAYAGSTASVAITLGSSPASPPPWVAPVPATVRITSSPSPVLATQTLTYREAGDVNATHCWLDQVAISCGPGGVVLRNLSAGTHRFDVVVVGNGMHASDAEVWTIRAALPAPVHLRAHLAKRRATVTWNAIRGASAYVVTETINGVPHTTTSHARTLRLTLAPHTRVSVAVHGVTATGRPGANAVITVG